MMRAHLIIQGQVVGVGFREFVSKVAENLNLTGFIKNLLPSSVEIVLEGSDDGVMRGVQLCQRGPKLSKVTDSQVTESKYIGEFSKFEIRE